MIPSGLLTGRILRPARIFPSFQKPVFSLKTREGGEKERITINILLFLPPSPLYLTKLNYQFEIIERYTLFLSVRTGEGNVTKLTYAKRHRIYRRSQLPFAIGPNPYRFPSTNSPGYLPESRNSAATRKRLRLEERFSWRNSERRRDAGEERGACNCRNPTRVRSLAHATNARVIWALGARQRRGMRGEVTEFGRVEKKRRRRRSRTNGRASRGGGQRYRLDDINVAPAISILCLLVSP